MTYQACFESLAFNTVEEALDAAFKNRECLTRGKHPAGELTIRDDSGTAIMNDAAIEREHENKLQQRP
jgi:hypothetical protein